MKIISKFKDYYDYVAFQYGEDPLIRYNRQPIDNDTELLSDIDKQLWYKSCYFPSRHNNDPAFRFKWLVINAKLYLLYSENMQPYKVLTSEMYTGIINTGDISSFNSSWATRVYPYLSGYSFYIGNDRLYNELVELSRKLNAPVFEIGETSFGEILSNNKCKVPVLSELGIASIIPPDQLFQELAYFIGNIMKDTPDTNPPVVIDNDLRIEGHGFDLKKSFRHR